MKKEDRIKSLLAHVEKQRNELVTQHSAGEKVVESAKKEGKDLWDTYSLLGWQTVGQHLVYKYERSLSFLRSANLCGTMERHVKAAKRGRFLDEQVFGLIFEASLYEILLDILAKKAKVAV